MRWEKRSCEGRRDEENGKGEGGNGWQGRGKVVGIGQGREEGMGKVVRGRECTEGPPCNGSALVASRLAKRRRRTRRARRGWRGRSAAKVVAMEEDGAARKMAV